MLEAYSSCTAFHWKTFSCKTQLKWYFLISRWMLGWDNRLQTWRDQRATKVRDVGHVRLLDKPSSVQQWANKQSIAGCNHNLYLYRMTKAHASRFSLSDTLTNAHTQNSKIKPAQLVTFVPKVPVRMDQFSNLQWQEADWHSWRQTEFNKRILPVLMLIIIITFGYVFVK